MVYSWKYYSRLKEFSHANHATRSIEVKLHQSRFARPFLHLDSTIPDNMSLQSRQYDIKRVEEEFMDTWSIILKDIKSNPKYNDIRSQIDWLEKVMVKTVPFEKHDRTYLSMFLFRSLKPDRTEEDDFLNYVNGWVIRMSQAAVAILGDVMYDSESRDGLLCWHQTPEAGLGGLNDAFMLECVAYNMAFKYFEGKDYLMKMVEIFRANSLCFGFGEQLALDSKPDTGPDFSKFTESTYNRMVKYKMGRFYFYGPMASALLRAGIQDKASLDAVQELAMKFGDLFQLQEDFLDCFGDPTLTGKSGTDISDGKLTWLILKALELGSDSQKEILQACYGKDTILSVNKVKNIYYHLKLDELFYKQEDVMKLKMNKFIRKLPKTVPQEPFLSMLGLMYRRDK